MKIITSRDNSAYKDIHTLLRSRRQRRETQLTVIEGVHLCQAYFIQGKHPLQIWVTEQALKESAVSELIRCTQGEIYCISEKLFSALSTLEQGIGLLCLIRIPQITLPDSIRQSCLLLDRIQDPGNLGTLIRTAAAAGHSLIYCGPGCVDPWSPKVLRAGMGAHFYLDIIQDPNWLEFMERLAIPLIATEVNAKQDLYSLDLSEPCAWLFGNEGAGIDSDLLKKAMLRIRIPQPGKIESLNVAAAGAICLFEQVRQQQKKGK